MKTINSKGTIWQWSGDSASWFFLTLDKPAQKKLEALKGKRRGWGQVAVTVTLGATTWDTSVFPDKTQGWVLPIKATVRKKEKVGDESEVKVRLKLK